MYGHAVGRSDPTSRKEGRKLKVTSLLTSKTYDLSVPVVEEYLTRDIVTVRTRQTGAEQFGEFRRWVWANDENTTALFAASPSTLYFPTGVNAWAFNPPWEGGQSPLTGFTDLVALAITDYKASGKQLRAGYNPQGYVTPLDTYNETWFAFDGDPDGTKLRVGVGFAILRNATPYFDNLLGDRYKPEALDDPATITAITIYLATTNATGVVSTTKIIRAESSNHVDDTYREGDSGLSHVGIPEAGLAFSDLTKYDSNVSGLGIVEIPSLYLFSGSMSQFSNTYMNNQFLSYSPIMTMATLTDAYADYFRANTGGGVDPDPGPDNPLEVPSMADYICPTSLGFVTMYALTPDKAKDLAAWFWSDDIGKAIRDWVTNPSDAVISLSVLPFELSTEVWDGTTVKIITFGNVSSGIAAPLAKCTIQKTIPQIVIPQTFLSYLDYQTTIDIYLPYVGYVPLDVDRFMGSAVGITYNVDVLTGSGICFLTDATGKVIQQMACNMGRQIPITAADYSQAVRNVLNVAGGVANTIIGAASGNPASIIGGVSSAAGGLVNQAIGGGMQNRVLTSFSGAPAQVGQQTPYIVIRRPVIASDGDFGVYLGRPDYGRVSLAGLSGYATVDGLQMESSCTAEEYSDIVSKLREGAIF